jgi:hypothetical protein
MSKGYGSVQRQVLALLRDHAQTDHANKRDTYVTVFDMADAMTPADQDCLDWSLIESVRRAVKTLEAKGEVETATIGERRAWTRGEHPPIKRMLAARLTGGAA